MLFFFLGFGKGKKKYRYFDPITQKIYMSSHVVFLEHIPFFIIIIPSISHNLTRFDLIFIDSFSKDSNSLSSQVPNTSHTSSNGRPIRTNHFAGTDTLFSSILEALFFL